MAILNVPSVETSTGIKKGIDKNSKAVALDILQRGIYAFPIQSTIRELVSNAYDAINERITALSILNKESKVEDHFDVTKEGDVYHASGWNPDYFDIKHLSSNNNTYIFYDEGINNDILRIKDNGVGIGQDRMVGYFQLAWSSKRSQKGALGKWGLGSKVALSLGVDSFTVISIYNGKKFKFEVYMSDIVSTTSKFNSEGKNDSIVVTVPQEEGDKEFEIFYEPTTQSNGLELIISVKKHNKQAFFNAIESQLMYIPNIIFQTKTVDALNYSQINIAAEILYKDSNIVIADNSVYDKPHILLGTGDGLINYGFIAFNELELDPKKGAVGLILDINDVEVTPSRESVIWSPKTRTAVLNSYSKVVDTATKLINNDLLNETDYLAWIHKTAIIKNSLINTKANSDSSSIIQKLAGLIDQTAINKIVFKSGAFSKRFNSDPLSMFGDKLLVRTFLYDSYNRKIIRTKLKTVNTIGQYKAIYITKGASDKYKDRYISEELNNGTFIVIKTLEGWNLEHTSNLIGKSTFASSYDSVLVPEAFMDKYLLEEADSGVIDDDDSSTTITLNANRLAALRKKEQKILYHQMRKELNDFVYSSTDVKIIDIVSTFKDQTVVYGTFQDRDLIDSIAGLLPVQLLSFTSDYDVSWEFRNNNEAMAFVDSYLKDNNFTKVNFILISKDAEKHFTSEFNFIHINDYIIESYNDGKLVFNKMIRAAITFKLLHTQLDGSLFQKVDQLMGDEYVKFFSKPFRDVLVVVQMFNSRASNKISNFIQNCINYESRKTDKDVAQEFLEYIDTSLPESLCPAVDEITDLHIFDLELVNNVALYSDYFNSYKILLNQYSLSSNIIKLLTTLLQSYEKLPTATLSIY